MGDGRRNRNEFSVGNPMKRRTVDMQTSVLARKLFVKEGRPTNDEALEIIAYRDYRRRERVYHLLALESTRGCGTSIRQRQSV